MLVLKQTQTSYNIKNISAGKLMLIVRALTALTSISNNDMANDIIAAINREIKQETPSIM